MNKNLNKFLALVAIAFLGACSISKDIHPPKDVTPQVFRGAPENDTLSIAHLPWKTFFGDQKLQQLIQAAITRNYDMQIALKHIQSAELLYRQRKWNNLPTLSLALNASTVNPSDNSLSGQTTRSFLSQGHLEDYTAGVTLSWEADIWGKIKNQNSLAAARYLQSSQAKHALQTSLIAAVSTGYYNLQMLDQQLEIAKNNLALNDSTFRIIKFQFEAGLVTSLALQQAQAQRLTAGQLIPKISQDILIQENALQILAGAFPAAVARNKMPAQLDTGKFHAGLPVALLANRPDIREKELSLTIANASVGITKAARYPSVTITASGGLSALKASEWFNLPGSLFAALGGGLTQPLLQGRKLQTAYKTALIERDKAVIEFRKSILLAVGEVSDALARIEKREQESLILSKRVDTLKQAIANARLLFQGGKATYLEVITAQGNVLQAELELAALQNAQRSAFSDLYRSLGGGWR